MKVLNGAKSKNKHSSSLNCSVVGLSEAATKLFLKISQYPQETLELESVFKKSKVWRPATLLKRDPNKGVFLWILLPDYLFRKTLPSAVFDCINCSLLHGPKGSRSTFYDGVRLQDLSHCSRFLFLSWHLSSWTESRLAFENLRPLMSQLSFILVVVGRFRWF